MCVFENSTITRSLAPFQSEQHACEDAMRVALHQKRARVNAATFQQQPVTSRPQARPVPSAPVIRSAGIHPGVLKADLHHMFQQQTAKGGMFGAYGAGFYESNLDEDGTNYLHDGPCLLYTSPSPRD